MRKNNIYVNWLKCVFYKPEHNAKGRPMEVNFEVLKTQKIKYINGQKSQSRQEKWGHLPYYHIYS